MNADLDSDIIAYADINPLAFTRSVLNFDILYLRRCRFYTLGAMIYFDQGDENHDILNFQSI